LAARPDDGQIFVKGQDVDNLIGGITGSKGALMECVSEDSLSSGMSVYENVAYRLYEHEWDDDSIESLTSASLVGSRERKTSFAGQLSAHEAQG